MDPTPLAKLHTYLEASRQKYDACLDHLDVVLPIPRVTATVRFHYLRLDANGVPKFKDLALCLVDHVIEFCLSARRRGAPKAFHEFSRLNREARALLRQHAKGGESGEFLLYLLMEAVLLAPQVVAKMDLKTNPKMEVHGSDGIHMRYDANEHCLDVFFGEAKLEQSVTAAVKHAFESIASFHAAGLVEHEFGLVTSHFKHLDAKLQEAVLEYVDRLNPKKDCRINHAMLVGFTWSPYPDSAGKSYQEAIDQFVALYTKECPKLHELLTNQFDAFAHKHLRYDVFFLPFPDVQSFRDAFNAALNAE